MSDCVAPGCDYACTFKRKRSVFKISDWSNETAGMAKKHSASEFCSDETPKDLWNPLRRTIYKQNYERHSARRNESRSKAHSSKAYSRRNSDTVSECVSSRQQKWETVCCSKVRLFPYCDKKKIAQFALIMKLNRGGLSIPTGLTRTVRRYCYLVFSRVIADGSFVTKPLSEGNKESARCSHTNCF